MSKIFVDIGNTRVKFARPAGPQRELRDGISSFLHDDICYAPTRGGDFSALNAWLVDAKDVEFIISSVNSVGFETLRSYLGERFPAASVRRLVTSDIPLATNVAPEEGMGVDRVLASYAASLHCSAEAALVIGAGTAVTMDLLLPSKLLNRGIIHPGKASMLDALLSGTEIPSESRDAMLASVTTPPPPAASTTTIPSLGAGIYAAFVGGVCFAAKRILDELPEETPFEVFLTGGDAPLLNTPLEELVCHYSNAVLRNVSNLVLEGIGYFSHQETDQ